jgi:hypothetical protein
MFLVIGGLDFAASPLDLHSFPQSELLFQYRFSLAYSDVPELDNSQRLTVSR